MAAFKLKNNIMDIVCRTCLKMNKSRFNIFEDCQNNRLISDMIMECTNVKVQKDDGFPINICSNCLEKLTMACDFKEMAILSHTKLYNFYQSKRMEVEKHLRTNENLSTVFIKEEPAIVKDEQIDPLFDFNDNSNYRDNTKRNLTENTDEQYTISATLMDKSRYIENLQERNSNMEQIILSKRENSNATINDICTKNENTQEIELIKEEELIEKEILLNCKSPINLDLSSDDSSKHANDTDQSHDKSEYENDNITTKQILSIEKRKKKQKDSVFCNVKHVELLDNPDYQKIMKMGLSRKEKDKATVFCRDCSKTFTFRYFVAVHAHIHTGNMPFKCKICGKYYAKEYLLKQHVRDHSKTKRYSCDLCNKTFSTIFSARYHKAIHSEERPHKCEICYKTFKLIDTLKKHLLIHKDRKYICEVCGKSFIDVVRINKHKMTHVTEKNFTCATCGKSFKSKTNLSQHVKRHSDNKPYVCSYCGKRFKCKPVLQNHVLIHTGAKPYSCNICGKEFRQRNCVARHIRIHTGETPFPCKICPCRFKYSHHLQNHMKVHEKGLLQEKKL